MHLERVRASIAILIGVFGLLFVLARPASAFTVSPIIIDLDIDSGKAAQGALRISNDAEQTQTYFVSVQKFVAQGEEGQQEFLPEEDRSGLSSWITPQARAVTLGPKETMDFTYVVNVPERAEPGGHYAAVFFSTRPDVQEDSSSVGMGAKTGILFLLKVPGDIKEDARVESFRVSGGSRIDRLPAYFELRIRNLGNVHFRPEGTIVIKNIFGSVAARVPVNPRRSAVLPNSIRRVETAWAKTFDEVEGEGFITGVKNEWRNFAIGRYTADLEAIYGSGKQTLRGDVTFWVFPWRLTVIAVSILLLLIVLFKLYNRMVIRAALKQMRSKKM
ncbi:hypothetical protein KJ781_03455 [Patescibacteria group bacterium]|nr:hypothetical protein [Patescibacteria group bacterium]MBU1448682.1 hypothetical protein [Patescibacteria group bacterium]MBU2613347.1 hypothetical protein [Patescibacteria group bacterium]